ncbi:hypothetical protein [Marasmitruncus massiliensis]|uniref:hypothetical protein n=1 Tax=Marasmitruncus massiliensis TaxID=1944642 RepID=UPI000C7DCB74|nr:hypothetical protein [Marasmitruncus massiliensis]
MKKVIAALLAGTCVATMGGLGVFAAEEVDVKYTIDFESDYVYNDDGVDAATTDGKQVTDGEFAPTGDIWIPMDKLLDKVFGTDNLKDASALSDDDLFKKKFDKGDDDTKIISKISFQQKNVVKDTTIFPNERENAIHVELNNDYTDDDFKISPEITFTAKEDLTKDGKEAKEGETVTIAKGSKFTIDFTAHVSNETRHTDDESFDAGTDGIVVKPEKDEDNTITWQDENDDIAKLEFEGDSDVNKYFPKLSTKWSDSDYAENFAGQDAYIFDFVGHPTISATSRPLLTIYNPFYDEDEDQLTVPAEDVVVYEVVDGSLVDVTDKFTAGQNDDGDEVFTIKTRTLGTYIFAEAPASSPDEEIAEPAPEDEEKPNPGTGRF